MQTNPSLDERQRCLSCHAPAVTVFPQHAEKIAAQVLSGKPQVEGIGCASCHLINAVGTTPLPPPTYKVKPGEMLYGPYTDPEENLVHPATQVPLFRGANFCTSCHFDKVKDVTQKDLPGEILHGTICQDCHMKPSTGSSTSRRGAMTRAIGRHWFRGVVIPGTLLKNRNLQAEWMPRIDIDAGKSGAGVEGTVLVKVGSLPHSFPDGDPVLKQFFLSITTKDAQGRVLGEEIKQFGLPSEKILRVRHRYPVVPWDWWNDVTPDFVLPVDTVARESLRWIDKPAHPAERSSTTHKTKAAAGRACAGLLRACNENRVTRR